MNRRTRASGLAFARAGRERLHRGSKKLTSIGTSADSARKALGRTKIAEKRGGRRGEQVKQTLSSILPDLVFLAGACFIFVRADNIPNPSPDALGPGFWPRVLSGGVAILATIRLVLKVLTRKGSMAQPTPGDGSDSDLRWHRVPLAVALVTGYVVSTLFLGFVLATALFIISFLYLGGQRRWYVIPMGILGSLAFTYIFIGVVYVALPSGVGVFDQLSVFVYRALGIF